MPPEVICISSSPAQIFARSPTPVVCESPLGGELSPLSSSPPSIPALSSLLGTPSISRSQPPQKTRKITPTGKQTDKPADNGTMLSGRVGQENVPLSNSKEDAAGKKTGTSRKSSESKARKRVTKAATVETTKTAPSKTGNEGRKSRVQKPRVVDRLSTEGLGATVTKPGAGSAPKITTEDHAGELRTPSPSDAAESCKDSLSWEPGCLELDEATSRKVNWTPPKHSPTHILNLTNVDDDDPPSNNENRSSSTSKNFGNLFSTYGFSKQPKEHRGNNQRVSVGGPTNKRRIELVDQSLSTSRIQTPSAEDQESNEETSKGVTKPKRAQKRKLTTITAYATAGYMNNDEETEAALDPYFPQKQGDKNQDTKKKRTSKPRQPRKKEQAQNKKVSNEIFEIFPPEKAIESFTDQELFFGTLSQLERDESPTLTRDTQLALKNSESFSTPTISVGTPELNQGNLSLCTSFSGEGSATSRWAGSRNLWSVGTRDFDGSLAKADVIDLIDTPKASEVLAKIKPLQSCNEEWLDIDTIPDTPSRDVCILDQEQVHENNDIHTVPDKNEEKDDQPPAVTNENMGNTDTALPEKPAFGGYSTADLSKQLTSYGFKAIKGRERMIALLEKCWESKHQNTNTAVSTVRPSPAPTTEGQIPDGSKDESGVSGGDKSMTSNKTKQQRAKKGESSDISTQKNKGSTQADRPPQTSGEKNETTNPNKEPTSLPKRAAPKASSSKKSTSVSSNRQSLPDLSRQIKSAIQTQLPTPSSDCGRKQLTWHEKILMYDPIVLEDLATWLNTEGLGRIGEDREVSAGFVREWCENEGICCCWKKGLDMPGGSRGAWK